MRSCASVLLVVALLAPLATRTVAQASQAQSLYTEANAREATLRREFDAPRGGQPTASLLRRVRTLSTAYEDMAALFPSSGYSDNALWKGALLSADAFWLFGEEADRATAMRLFSALTTRFPSSSLVRQVDSQLKRLQKARVASSPASPAAPVTPTVVRAPAPDTAARTPTSPTRRASTGTHSSVTMLNAIRREVLPDALRITLELEREVAFHAEKIEGPPRVFVDLMRTRAVEPLTDATIPFPDDVVKKVRIGRQADVRTRVVLDLDGAGRYSVYALYDPYRVVIDFERAASVAGRDQTIAPAATESQTRVVADVLPAASPARWPVMAQPAKVVPPTDARVAPETKDPVAPKPVATVAPTSEAAAPVAPSVNRDGGFSLSRQLGLGVARIVIDAGHGGRDPGAKVRGLSEADLVLDVALRLEQLLLKQPGFEVVLTRRADVYVPLEERTAIANRADADLFLSIHANASGTDQARGVETYFLNFAGNKEAEALAARENAGSSRTMRNLPDIVRAIALNNKIDESRDFASMLQASMYARLRKANRNLKNLGVKQAPFSVLIGATMPSVLAEIAFITNRQESTLLKTEKYRQQIAEALLTGVVGYQQSLKKVPVIAAH